MPQVQRRLRQRAKSLRRAPTEAEKALLRILKSGRFDDWHFRRQHPIPPYFADIACVSAMLVIEADGGQHAESARDARWDAAMQARGWQVMRFWNHEILANPDGVSDVIRAALDARRTS